MNGLGELVSFHSLHHPTSLPFPALFTLSSPNPMLGMEGEGWNGELERWDNGKWPSNECKWMERKGHFLSYSSLPFTSSRFPCHASLSTSEARNGCVWTVRPGQDKDERSLAWKPFTSSHSHFPLHCLIHIGEAGMEVEIESDKDGMEWRQEK